jgi:hypothetical protein
MSHDSVSMVTAYKLYYWTCWRPSTFTLITSHLIPGLPGDLFPSSFPSKYFTNYVTLIYTSGLGKAPADPRMANKLQNTKICCGFLLTGFQSSDRLQFSGILLMRFGSNFGSNYLGGGGEALMVPFRGARKVISATGLYVRNCTPMELTAIFFRVEDTSKDREVFTYLPIYTVS